MIQTNKITQLFQSIGDQEHMREYLVIINGQINQEIIVAAIKLAETKLNMNEFPKNVITKMKTISAEILQNIIKHQKKDDNFPPYFVMGIQDKTIRILSGNLIGDESRTAITAGLDKYKTIAREELRDYYMEAFKSAEVAQNGNSGLGLLDIVYRCNQNVTYNIKPHSNGLHAYDLTVSIVPESK